MNTKKAILVLILLCVTLLSVIIYKTKVWQNTESLALEQVIYAFTPYNAYANERDDIWLFVLEHLTENGAIDTNLVESSSGDVSLANGGEQLSESMGLAMLYAIEVNDLDLFKSLYSTLENRFVNAHGLYAWRINTKDTSVENTVNASVDDLRIYKALKMASDKWSTDMFDSTIKRLSGALYQYCVKGQMLLAYENGANEAPMVYYDLASLKLLSNDDHNWQSIYERGLNRISNEMTDLPFFESTEGENFGAIENFLIVQYLAEAGYDVGSYVDFFMKELQNNGLKGSYNLQGKTTTDIESPSVYGIVAYVGKLTSNDALYHLASEKLISLQVKEGIYSGGFVFVEKNEAYSFDQLYALLGL